MPLLNMPNEILHEIGRHLPQRDLLSLLKTSSFCARLFAPILHRFAFRDRAGLPAILWAAQRGYTPLLHILLRRGIDVDTALKSPAPKPKRRTPVLVAGHEDGETALHLAAFAGHQEAVRVLLSQGANAAPQSTRLRETPLHKALKASARNVAVVKLLADASGGAGINAQQIDGTSALHLAAVRGDRALVQLLLDSGATVDTRDMVGSTPLHWAVSYRHTAVVKLLLREGADINARDRAGTTPLMRSAAPNPGRGGWAILRLLLDNGAATNLKNNAGHTALDLAGGSKNAGKRAPDSNTTLSVKVKLLKEFERKRVNSLRGVVRAV